MRAFRTLRRRLDRAVAAVPRWARVDDHGAAAPELFGWTADRFAGLPAQEGCEDG